MEVFFLRHGTRNFTTGDVPLNADGQNEALQLAEDKAFAEVTTLLSSPKQRARQTITPLARQLCQEILILDELDQMRPLESGEAFRNRVKSVLHSIEQSTYPSGIVICSHSDWLSLAVGLIPCDDSELSYFSFHCAQYLHFKIQDGLWLRQ